MIDIHSHLLHGIDDGASSLEEALKMVSEAEKLGIKVIAATPHYHQGIYEAVGIEEKFNELLQEAAGSKVKIVRGAEVFLSPDVYDTVMHNESLLMNGTRYILIELPCDYTPLYLHEAIYRLQLNGIKVIIAHPERNRCFLRSFKMLSSYIECGCLLQIDAGSITGVYGLKVRRMAKKILKYGMAHFVASDAHCANDYTERYGRAYRKSVKWVGEEYTRELFSQNAGIMLEIRDLSTYT